MISGAAPRGGVADLQALYQAAAYPGWHRRRDTYASRKGLPEQS